MKHGCSLRRDDELIGTRHTLRFDTQLTPEFGCRFDFISFAYYRHVSVYRNDENAAAVVDCRPENIDFYFLDKNFDDTISDWHDSCHS